MYMGEQDVLISAPHNTPVDKVIRKRSGGLDGKFGVLIGVGYSAFGRDNHTGDTITHGVGFGGHAAYDRTFNQVVTTQKPTKIRSLLIAEGAARLADKVLASPNEYDVFKQIKRLEHFLALSDADANAFMNHDKPSFEKK